MATVIRMARHGSKKRPYYRIVVADSRRARNGKFIELIGAYNPLVEDSFKVSRERLDYWLSVGAQMSTTVKNLLNAKVKELANPSAKKPKTAKPKKEAAAEAPAAQEKVEDKAPTEQKA